MRTILAATALALCALVQPAAAAKTDQACQDIARSAHAGKAINLAAPLDEPSRIGLGYSIFIALDGPPGRDWPTEAIAKAAPCSTVDFKVGDAPWVLSKGGPGDAPAAWARPKSGGDLVFLAYAPSVSEAYAFSQRDPKPASLTLKSPVYMLAVVHESRRFIVRTYDGLPPDDVLQADIAAAMRATLPLIASYDAAGRAVSFAIATQSDHRAILFPPLPGLGGHDARLAAADGELFKLVPNVGLRMAGSGYVCPAAAGGFGLRDLWVANASDDRRDLSCRYVGEASWISIFVTRSPSRPPVDKVFGDYVDEVSHNHKLKETTPPPVELGPGNDPVRSRAWLGEDGMTEGLWVLAIRDWYIEVRATYRPADSEKIGVGVAQLVSSAYRTVPAAEPQVAAPAAR